MTAPTTRSVLRSRSHLLLCLAVAAALGLLAAVNLAVAATGQAQPSVTAAVVLIVLALLALRFGVASIVVDRAQRTLVVRNPLRSYVVAVADIDHIGLRDSWVPNTYRNNRQLLVVVPRGGRRITMIGGCAIGGPAAVQRMRDDVLTALYGAPDAA